MQEKSSDSHPLSDLAYDWITLMQNKAQALIAYDQSRLSLRPSCPSTAAILLLVRDQGVGQDLRLCHSRTTKETRFPTAGSHMTSSSVPMSRAVEGLGAQ
jgi:hypothetical protein